MRRAEPRGADWSPEEYEAYIEKHQAWNFGVNLFDITFFNLAMSFIFGSTVLSLYTSYLTRSAVLIGLIPALQNVSFFWPQLLLARRIERLPRKKDLLVKVSLVERLPYFFVALLALLWPSAPRPVAYAVLALCLTVASAAAGLGGPAWNAMLAKVIPPTRRGRLFGLSSAFGGVLGVAGAALSSRILGTYPYPISFGLCFLLCFGAQILSYTGLALNREPPRAPTHEVPPAKEYWKRLPAVLRGHRNLRNYLIARTLMILGGMATTFYVIYGRTRFGMADEAVASLTIVALATQSITTPLFGLLADRRGNKLIAELACLFGIVGILLALAAPSANWLIAVFVAINISSAAFMIMAMSMPLDFGTPEELPTLVALSNTILALPILISPLLGGWLVDGVGYSALFGVAAALSAAGWAVMHWAVRDPRQELQAVRQAEAPSP